MRFNLRIFLIAITWGILPNLQAQVLFNEVHYNPLEDGTQEFIELYNPGGSTVRLNGYRFTDGIFYEFPSNALISPHGYLIVVRNTNSRTFRNVSNKVGPWIGKLADSGEKITLRGPDGSIVDEMKFSDLPPWPRGADGYGPSIEKTAPDLPSNDYRSWRTSNNNDGTPGAQNSVYGEHSLPFFVSTQVEPAHPTSSDPVTITARFDGAGLIGGATLYYQSQNTSQRDALHSVVMTRDPDEIDVAVFHVQLPAMPSQKLVRYKFELELKAGGWVYWPHKNDPSPFKSYFVYDDEIPTMFTILWMYSRIPPDLPETTNLTSQATTGVVIKPTDEAVQVYDGARIVASRNGQKVKFLKGEEYRGNRTLNIIPEHPTGGTTSGNQAPFVEHITYQVFDSFNVLHPGCEWYRVIEREEHSQRILIQQPNENFLALHDRNPDANIYKVAYNVPNGIQKQTNLDEGQEDLAELNSAIRTGSLTALKEGLDRYLVFEEVMNYSVAGVFMSNWDGFFNNMFLYHAPPPADKWECIPWDCDKTFGYTDSDHMFVEMPPEYPLNGQARQAARSPGYISGPFHSYPPYHEEFKRRMRYEMSHRFSEETMQALADHWEQILLKDADLEAQYTGQSAFTRRREITNSYDVIMTFVHLRLQYLDGVLPTSIDDWALME